MIGKLLGNTQVQTTERYAYLANDPVKAAANRIASRIADIAGLFATLRSAGEAEVSLPASKARLAVSYII